MGVEKLKIEEQSNKGISSKKRNPMFMRKS